MVILERKQEQSKHDADHVSSLSTFIRFAAADAFLQIHQNIVCIALRIAIRAALDGK